MRVGMARVLVTGLSATMWINLMPSLPFHADTVRVDSAHQRSCAQLGTALLCHSSKFQPNQHCR